MSTIAVTLPSDTKKFFSVSTLPEDYKTVSSTSTTGRLPNWRTYDILGFMKSLSFPAPVITEKTVDPAHQLVTEIVEPLDRESTGWLKLAESSFDFWDNESDAYFDTL